MVYFKFAGKHLGCLICVGMTLLWGCNNSTSADVASKPPDVSLSEAEPAQSDDESKPSIFADELSASTDSELAETATLLEGKWSPSFYIDPNGTATKIGGMAEAERAEFRWEFTSDGRVFSGEQEGVFSIDRDTISIENLSSGEITEFKFSIAEDELTLISDTNATLKLDRRSE